MTGFSDFISSAAPSKLTKEAFDEACAKLSRYDPKPFRYPPIPGRVYRAHVSDAIELGMVSSPLTWQTIFDIHHEIRQYDRFIAYMASMGYRPPG